jgi:hypothetical protein
MNFKDYFIKGIHGTLQLKGNTQFSYKNQWKQLYANTVLDQWHVGEIMSAEYTVVIDNGRHAKETIQAVVVAGPGNASISIIGRASLANNIVNLDVVVTDSSLQLTASPVDVAATGARAIFSATYYQTLTD